MNWEDFCEVREELQKYLEWMGVSPDYTYGLTNDIFGILNGQKVITGKSSR